VREIFAVDDIGTGGIFAGLILVIFAVGVILVAVIANGVLAFLVVDLWKEHSCPSFFRRVAVVKYGTREAINGVAIIFREKRPLCGFDVAGGR
jgi:hypothetical protein